MIIMGAFASMAQNDYGMIVLGIAATSFSIIFFIQCVTVFLRRDQYASQLIETVCLFVLSAIMAMRVFYIRFEFIEYVFALAGIVLVGVYVQKMLRAFRIAKPENKILSILVLIFYSSVIFYLMSMIFTPFISTFSDPVGMLAFLLISIAIIGNLVLGNILINKEKTTAYRFMLALGDRAMVLVALFLLFTCYMAFTKVGAVPTLYSDKFPERYYELVNLAETGKEIPMDGKFQHEAFKENFDRFIQRNQEKE
jgi:hypothetical protein